jgi:hypothetical protein
MPRKNQPDGLSLVINHAAQFCRENNRRMSDAIQTAKLAEFSKG